jgi:gliding motility-associated-like protein
MFSEAYLVRLLISNGIGWDGTYNGKTLLTDDYWFILEYMEPRDGKLKQFKSHFALKQ